MTTDPSPPTPTSDLRCDRVRLLLSLDFDSEATEAQCAEIEAHLPTCAACRAARAADAAVRERLTVLAAVPTGFADRVAAGVARQRFEARAQNRFLMGAAVAAVLVAGVALFAFDGGTGGRRGNPGLPVADGSPRAVAGSALRAGLAIGRAPHTGAKDR